MDFEPQAGEPNIFRLGASRIQQFLDEQDITGETEELDPIQCAEIELIISDLSEGSLLIGQEIEVIAPNHLLTDSLADEGEEYTVINGFIRGMFLGYKFGAYIDMDTQTEHLGLLAVVFASVAVDEEPGSAQLVLTPITADASFSVVMPEMLN